MKFEPLNEFELKLYYFLQKFLKMHKTFDLQTILPICFTEFQRSHSQLEITEAVNNLLKKRYFLPGTALSKDDIMNNQVRKRILRYIQVNPGAYNRLIRRDLNIGSNEFNWHVGMLEKFQLIKKMRFNRNYGYFENHSFMDHEYDLFLKQNGKVKKILESLEKQPATVSQLAKKLDLHWSTASKYIKVLVDRAFILVSLQPKNKEMYEINQTLQIKLKKIINGQMFIQYA